jgi:poly-gamma-glutamate capsule biosynthesis protein CapA/YwtB (metallophosphatase superfamily)
MSLVRNDGSISVALTGDAIITRPWSSKRDLDFLNMLHVVQSQDAAFTNLEICLLDYETYPMVESGGLHLRASPALAKELSWAGFRLVSFANNHANDWGVDGLRLTCQHLRAAGLVVAGVGEDLLKARAPQFLNTAKGRIALIACASTFTTNARAGATLGDIPARPGLSPLRATSTNILSPAGILALRALAAEFGQALAEDGPLTFLGQSYELGDHSGRQSTPHPQDQEEIAAAVRSARATAQIVIVSIHAHEQGDSPNVPASFLMTFARAMIDAGADVVVGHGPHALRGIEIYRGKPIFYSLGNFVFENETVDRLPLEDYEAIGADPAHGVTGLNAVRYDHDRRGFPARREAWESVIAVPRWKSETLRSIELHPLSLGFGQPRMLRGTPHIADEETGRRIIEDLHRLSNVFGTSIAYRAGIGLIAVDP